MDTKEVGEQHLTYHEEDGKSIINSYQDVEPHLEYAAQCRREDAERRGAFGKRQEMRRTMSVPFNVIEGICNKYNLNFFEPDDAKVILKILKGPEYKGFHTTIDKHL